MGRPVLMQSQSHNHFNNMISSSLAHNRRWTMKVCYVCAHVGGGRWPPSFFLLHTHGFGSSLLAKCKQTQGDQPWKTHFTCSIVVSCKVSQVYYCLSQMVSTCPPPRAALHSLSILWVDSLKSIEKEWYIQRTTTILLWSPPC
jgi:hypothetical protein